MNIKIQILFLIVLVSSCNAQQAQATLPKVSNHLIGELDYTHEPLKMVRRQANGEEVSLGKINTDGTIQFNLPEYDIKSLYDSMNLQRYDFHQLFKIDSGCKDRDVLQKHLLILSIQKKTTLFT